MKKVKEAERNRSKPTPSLLSSALFFDEEQKQKLFVSSVRRAGRIFEILDWFIIAASLYFFLGFYWFRLEPVFLFINLLALAQSLVYHRLFFFNLSRKRPTLALNIDISFFLVMLILLTQLFGGIASPMAFIYIVVLGITAFFFSPYFIFISLLLEFLVIYVFILSDLNQLNFISSYNDIFIWEIILLGASAILFFIGSLVYSKQKKELLRLEDFSNQLVADKVKSEAVLQSMSDGVFVVSRERKLLFLNDAALGIIKSKESKERLLGHFYGSVFKFRIENKSLDYARDCPLELAITERKPNSRNDLSISVFGKPVFVIISSAPIIDAAGDARGAVAIIRDITKEKEMEKMQMEFVSVASHELLTPITQVQGHLSMVVDEKIGKLDETASKLVGNAYKGIKRVSRLVKDLMNISRIERGAMKINPVEVDISQFIESVVRDFKDEVQSEGLKLVFNKPKRAIPVVLTDSNRLGEVLNNLIGNALKFTKEGGITISLSEKKDGFVVIAVRDTGIGIVKENIPLLFNKFYQVDSSATREAEGTGLGLYISKTIIEMLGGKIWVESKLGEGSTFYFSIPRAIITQKKGLAKK